MTLKELKQSIQDNEILDTFMIFVCDENTFLATSYVNAICEAQQLEKTVVDSIFSQDSALSLVMGFENNFRVIYTDTFNEIASDYSQFTNTAIICSAVDKKLLKAVSEYIIKVPVLKDWQVKAYIKQQCPVLSEADVEDLYAAAGGDIYRIDSQLEQIKLFDPAEQGFVAIQLAHTAGTHIYDIATFDLVDAIVFKNMPVIKNYLEHAQLNGNEFLGLVSLLINKVKTTLFAEYSTKSAQDLGMSDKQLNHLRYNRKGIPIEVLQQKLEFLTSLDLQLKSGLLDISNKEQIDYLIVRLVS